MLKEKFKYTINQELIVINIMVIDNITTRKIIVKILKDFSHSQTITSLSKELKLSRVGIWKILRKLESENLIILNKIGKGKTSTYTLSLNWTNALTEKILALYLSQEAQEHQRWVFNFVELEKEVEFLILFGSILHSPKEANDIDIIGVARGKNFGNIKNISLEIQKTLAKDVHSINFTKEEFERELKKPNEAILDAVKKGVVLFGQDSFIKFIRDISK